MQYVKRAVVRLSFQALEQVLGAQGFKFVCVISTSPYQYNPADIAEFVIESEQLGVVGEGATYPQVELVMLNGVCRIASTGGER